MRAQKCGDQFGDILGPCLVREVAEQCDTTRRGTLLCSHRPVLPTVFAALGVPDPRLEPGEMLVVHLRKGRVVATEKHLVG